MVLYDVWSLFTRFPLTEKLEIADELIKQKNPNLKISKNEFDQLFKVATSGSYISDSYISYTSG